MARAAVLPASPVKRGTRTAPRTTASKSKTTAEARKRAPAMSVPPTNRAAHQDIDSDDTEDELGMMMKEPEEKPARPRARLPSRPATKATTTRGKKVACAATETNREDQSSNADVARKRVGRPKRTVQLDPDATKAEPAPRGRGRPKAVKTSAPTRKTTRAVAGSDAAVGSVEPRKIVVATNSTIMRSNLLRGPAKKKTVTFEDASDSETEEVIEEPAPAVGRRKAVGQAGGTGKIGLGATPVRKPAATGTRGRKPVAKKEIAKPLSPKKAKQLAKSLSAFASSDGEEDELTAVKDDLKSPVRLVVHSPTKNCGETTGLSSPVRRINFTPKKVSSMIDENGEPKLPTPKHGSTATGLSSPVRRINFTPNRSQNTDSENVHLAVPPGKSIDFSDSIFMSSPARRPEMSPFQFSIRDMPNHGRFRSDAKAVPAHETIQEETSPLRMSPKKGKLGASFLQSPEKASTPAFPAQSSLFQSPAKKIASPFKTSLFASNGPANEAPSPVCHSTVPTKPSFASSKRTSLLLSIESDEPAPDDDLEIVQEVARDILGVELQSDIQTPLDLPSPREEPQREVTPESEHDLSDGIEREVRIMAETVEEDDQDVDKKLEQLQEEIRHEPDDFGTICFDTIEELQRSFRASQQHGAFVNGPASEDDVFVDEPEVDGELIGSADLMEFSETSHRTSNHFMETQQEKWVDAQRTESSPPPSEPPLELEALEEAQSPIVMPIGDHQDVDEQEQSPEHYKDAEQSVIIVQDDQETDCEEDLTEDDKAVFFPPERNCTIISRPFSPCYEELEAHVEALASTPSILPPAPTPPVESPTFLSMSRSKRAESHQLLEINTDIRWDDEGALDTTLTEIASPKRISISNTPSVEGGCRTTLDNNLGFTPLAQKFSRWESHTPSQDRQLRPRRRGVFSLVGPLERSPETHIPDARDVSYPDLSGNAALPNTPSLFAGLPLPLQSDDSGWTPRSVAAAESPISQHDHDIVPSPRDSEIFEDPETVLSGPEELHEPLGKTLEDHEGDSSSENDDKENNRTFCVIPMTPVKIRADPMRTIHTVSKVPLKAEGEVSPLKMPRKRGLSLSGASPTRSSPRIRRSILLSRTESAPALSPPRKSSQVELGPSPKRRCSTVSRRSNVNLTTMAPPKSPSPSSSGKTPRRRLSTSKQALRGAVVHVDVHTTEGEDASGIFVELLQQMGARCVKSWSWNPQASLSPVDGVDPMSSKVGITHVVYKDGGLRTLEKVKHAAGLVKCVGVGWVLDCERENKWLDESSYAVDSSIIPRGGAKRRKSMEPRALSNVNGTLVPVPEPSTPSASGRRHGADRGAVEGFRKITPPTPLAGVPSTPTRQSSSTARYQVPKTPGYDFAKLDAIGMSPATPYFLSNRAQLVQQSCPPKQSNRGLFPTSKSTLSFEEESEEDVRRQQRARMEAARRKSHFYRPAVQSPLAR